MKGKKRRRGKQSNQWPCSHSPTADLCQSNGCVGENVPSALLLSMMLYGVKYCFRQLRFPRSCVPSQPLVSAACRHCGCRGRKREGLDAVQALFSTSQDIGVLLTVLVTSSKHSIIRTGMKISTSISAKPSTGS